MRIKVKLRYLSDIDGVMKPRVIKINTSTDDCFYTAPTKVTSRKKENGNTEIIEETDCEGINLTVIDGRIRDYLDKLLGYTPSIILVDMLKFKFDNDR